MTTFGGARLRVLIGVALTACGCNNGTGTTGLSFASLSAGNGHACGLTPTGAAYCWGYNGYGDLGNKTTTGSATPVAVFGGITFTAVSVGDVVGTLGQHTCGLTGAGVAYCWGYNVHGQLGNGTTSHSATPVAVWGFTFATVSAGGFHTCGLTPTGAAYCWGSNASGALGNGTTTTDSATPVAVSGGLTFATLSSGTGHTCGVTTAGAAYCWGDNGDGQLGDSTTTNRWTPVPVSGGLSFVAVNSGSGHTCGVTAAGATYCWGNNFYGQLGDGTNTSKRHSGRGVRRRHVRYGQRRRPPQLRCHTRGRSVLLGLQQRRPTRQRDPD